jgi:hypothetical protein
MDERQFNVPDCLYCLYSTYALGGDQRERERGNMREYRKLSSSLSLACLAVKGVEGAGFLEWRW